MRRVATVGSVLFMWAFTALSAVVDYELVLRKYMEAPAVQAEFERDARRHFMLQTDPTTDVSKFLSFSEEIRSKWQGREGHHFISLGSSVGIGLLTKVEHKTQLWPVAIDLGASVLRRLGDSDLVNADQVMARMAMPVIRGMPGRKTALDFLDRNLVVESFMALIQRVEDEYLPHSTVGDMILPTRPPVPAGIFQINSIAMGPIEDPKLRLAYGESIWETQEQARISNMFHQFSLGRMNRREGLMQDFAKSVQNHFTTLPEDLDILEKAFDKHIKEPELKEKLILKCFNGTNPFLNRPDRGDASATAKRSNLRSKLEGQIAKGSSGRTSGSATGSGKHAASGGGAQTGVAIPGTPKGIVLGLGALALGAIGFILLRSKSRRNT